MRQKLWNGKGYTKSPEFLPAGAMYFQDELQLKIPSLLDSFLYTHIIYIYIYCILHVTAQFDWSVRGQYFTILPVPIEMLVILPVLVTRKSYYKYIIAIPPVGQYGEIFRSRPRYHPSLRSGRYS